MLDDRPAAMESVVVDDVDVESPNANELSPTAVVDDPNAKELIPFALVLDPMETDCRPLAVAVLPIANALAAVVWEVVPMATEAVAATSVRVEDPRARELLIGDGSCSKREGLSTIGITDDPIANALFAPAEVEDPLPMATD